MSHAVSKIRQVPLREVWKHEAYDFTQWLQENIDVLNAPLNIDLVSAEREQAAGAFSIDLVAEDSDGDSYVIENQLEKSNHDHLGKVITYYASMKAKGAIWIVAEPRPEHVTAMAWLNEANGANFYLVKVQAIRIDDSPAAPLLTLIVGPSEGAKEVGRVKQESAERHGLWKQWWTELISHPEAKMHAHLSPGEKFFLGTSAGKRGLTFTYTVTQDGCGAELYIDRGKGKDDENLAIFEQIRQHQAAIEAAVREPITWEPLENRQACRIRINLPGGYKSPREEWPAIQARVVRAMSAFESALRPLLDNLKVGA